MSNRLGAIYGTYKNSEKVITIDSDSTEILGSLKIDTIKGDSNMVIDPYPHDDITGILIIKGDLDVQGLTTTINSTTLDICDNRIKLNATTSIDAGIDISFNDGTSKSFYYDKTDSQWKTDDASLNIGSGIITAGAGIFNSGLTGNITGNVTGNVTGNADTATKIASITNTNIVQLTETQTLENKTLTNPTITGSGAIAGIFTGNVTGNVTGNCSGTAATVTDPAQTVITSVGTLTALQVDNLNIDGNIISATSGAVNIIPAAGSAIVLDETINVDAGVVTGATSITSTAFVGDLSGNVTGSSGSCTGNAATSTALVNARNINGVSFNGTSNINIPVAKSSFTIVKSNLVDLSGTPVDGGSTAFINSSGDTTFHDATNYVASKVVISGDSCIKMEFKVNFICSPEADQTISFRVRRTIGGNTTTVFTDENIGSNMGIMFRNVYNGTFIDDLSESTVSNGANVSYQLQYKRICPSGTISTNFGIVNGGNYIFLQEIYA